MTQKIHQAVWILVALCAVVLLIYSPVWHGAFLYDDLWYIVRNPFVHQPLSLLSLFTDARTTAAAASGLTADVYRPLTTLWFWMDAHLWGPHVLPYHMENLLLHMANGTLLFVFLRRWMGNPWAALAGCAVFLMHPIQVQSVAWITQRSSLASTTCLLASLGLLTAKSPRPYGSRWILGIVAAAAALLFRETPIVISLLFGVVCAAQESRWKEIPRQRKLWVTMLALMIVSVLYLGVRQAVLHHWSQLSDSNLSWTENAGFGILAFPVYLGKIVLPLKLRVSYAYPELHLPHLIMAALAGFLYLAGTWYVIRRDRWMGAGLLWILIGLLPVLQIVPIRAFVAERFLYLPMGGVAIIVCRMASRLTGRKFTFLWLIFLTVMTWRAVPAWRNEQTLWAETVKHDPGNAFARLCYGDALIDPAAASQQYRQALLNHPNADQHFAAVNNLANVSLQLGRDREAFIWAKKAVHERPESPEALYNLAKAALRIGRREEGISSIRRLERIVGPGAAPVKSLRQEGRL